MYSDLAYGSMGATPWTVNANSENYTEFVAWRNRCLSYYPRMYDPTMKDFYDEFLTMLRKQGGDAARWSVVYNTGVALESQHQIVNLRARLSIIEQRLATVAREEAVKARHEGKGATRSLVGTLTTDAGRICTGRMGGTPSCGGVLYGGNCI